MDVIKLKGLNPALIQKIAMLDNTTCVLKLETSIQVYDRARYLMLESFGIPKCQWARTVQDYNDESREFNA